MTNSVNFYEDACEFAKKKLTDLHRLSATYNPEGKFVQDRVAEYHSRLRDYYLQIETVVFYELISTQTSALLSKFCIENPLPFECKNLRIMTPDRLSNAPSSFDMYCVLEGLCMLFGGDLDACLNTFNENRVNMFQSKVLSIQQTEQLTFALQTLDDYVGKSFQNQSALNQSMLNQSTLNQSMQNRSALNQSAQNQSVSGVADEDAAAFSLELQNISQARHADDELIIDELKKIQLSMQDEVSTLRTSLKHIAEVRDGIDFALMREPITQLIELHRKLADNLKLHPQDDVQKGYNSLLRRCTGFLKYITQSLAMLGVELIDETGCMVDPDKHIVEDETRASLNATVEKIIRVGFIYKGKVLEKAVVEIAAPAMQNVGRSAFGKNFGFVR